jgi:NTP pyrophosphatase (non-canonical NTP hydrolase)
MNGVCSGCEPCEASLAIDPYIENYPAEMDLRDLQSVIEATYGDRDQQRGVPSTVAWLAEEIGELAQAVRKGSSDQQLHEFGDVLAWVASLANQMGVDLTDAVARYAHGCPRCAALPCACP